LNDKKYIGMCSRDDSEYLGSGILLKQAIQKYGKENFKREILEICSTIQDLEKAERHWIDKFDAVSRDEFYNLIDGGRGGNSNYLKKYWNSMTEGERKMARNWGRKTVVDGEHNPMFNKKHTDETKRKIGAKSVNRNWGRKTPVDGANNPRAKKVQLSLPNGNIMIFDCIKDISDYFSIPFSTTKSIKNKPPVSNKSKYYGWKITEC